jgi:transcriptional regulator with XRE-family HTH domain
VVLQQCIMTTLPEIKTLGGRIRWARRMRRQGGVTIATLAEAAGVHRTTLYRWELGETTPSVEEIKRLAEHLSVRLSWLVGS